MTFGKAKSTGVESDKPKRYRIDVELSGEKSADMLWLAQAFEWNVSIGRYVSIEDSMVFAPTKEAAAKMSREKVLEAQLRAAQLTESKQSTYLDEL